MRLERIWIKRAHRGPMDAVAEGRLEVGRGLAGNADAGRGAREITLLSAERWRVVMDAMGADLDPSARRANLLLSGVDLEHTRGRVLALGDCRIEILGENPPCRLMDRQLAGLQEALRPHWGAGVFARVAAGGTIRAGEPVTWLEPAAAGAAGAARASSRRRAESDG